jgi:hypothetical protein
MQRKYLWLFALTAAPFATLACANILGFERLEATAVDGGGDDRTASPDGPPVSSDAGRDTFVPGSCLDQEGFPGPPPPPDAGAGSDIIFNTAFAEVDLGADGAGFNLDGRCTKDDLTSSCILSPETTLAERWKDESNGGGDNAAAPLLAVVGVGGIFSAESLGKKLLAGKFGMGLRVEGYNGLPNDPKVTVFFLPFNGVRNPGDGVPSKQETDVWFLDDQFSLGGFTSIFASSEAYVRDGTLFARFPRIAVRVPVVDSPPAVLLDLSNAVIRARLEATDGGLNAFVAKDGQMGGRWGRLALLKSLGALRLVEGGDPVCTQPAFWSSNNAGVRDQICKSLDLAPTAAQDHGRPNGPESPVACDAVSVFATFKGYAVTGTDTKRVSAGLDAGGCSDDLLRCPCTGDAAACPD